MAAPTNVRVEAQSLTSAILRWSYGGTNSIAVYRSTDGSSYSEVTSTAANTRVLSGTTTYTDTTLTTGTKYWYKLSDDNGSTFSSAVTVYAMFCPSAQSGNTLQMPQASGDQPTSDEFNELSQKVEAGLNVFKSASGQTCVACISDGALVIDCINYDGCDQIDVTVDQDVNSISLPNCDDAIKQINFIVPPSATRKICGFPKGMGFSGDECFQAPISGGTSGTTMSVGTRGGDGKQAQSKQGVRGGGGGGGGAGGSGCTCVPGANGELTIKSCNSNNSLNCSSSKSLRLIACGGKAPYTWSKTGSVQLSATTGPSTTVTPPTNSGSGVAGDAYTMLIATCAPGTATVDVAVDTYSCADVKTGTCASGGTGPFNCPDAGHQITCSSLPKCKGTNTEPGNCNCGGGSFPGTTGVSPCTYCNASANGTVCDKRTATMISNGCTPCGLQAGATVTVTDALGTQTTIVLRA